MWFFNKTDGACPAFEVRLEEYLEGLQPGSVAHPDPVLATHLAGCLRCREALDQAREASALVREFAIPVPDSLAHNPFFAARVAARIRENSGRAGEFWPQLESVSIRMMAYALSLAVLLGALSASGFARLSQPAASLRPADPRAISLASGPAPVNPDEVVIALLSSERGRQQR
ncbi:MAG TPA: hypothetical protein VJW51_02110 [Candidatus Acidoferrales bacterium]|nr:hypothetical protein [Candidatus Acidoferrales bacterium]